MAETKEGTIKELQLIVHYFEDKLLMDRFFMDVSTQVIITNTVKHLNNQLKILKGE